MLLAAVVLAVIVTAESDFLLCIDLQLTTLATYQVYYIIIIIIIKITTTTTTIIIIIIIVVVRTFLHVHIFNSMCMF